MGSVGLLLVGPVLFVNGLVALGYVTARGAAPLNVLVGGAQVVLPTLVLVQHGSDPGVVGATWPSFLFGFTYLWYSVILARGADAQGFGWFSAFVAVVAAYQAVAAVGTDPAFAVSWASWALMWSLFFVLLALGRTVAGRLDLVRFTGWVLTLLGIPTCTIPAVLLIDGRWSTAPVAGLAALAVAVTAVALAASLARRPVTLTPDGSGADDASGGLTEEADLATQPA